MLRKKRRVQKESFPLISRSGKRAHASHISLSYSSLSKEEARAAFVVSKAVAKTAVARNTMRRRASAVVEKNWARIPAGTQAIFFFKKGAESLSSKQIEMEILSLLDSFHSS